jgi:rubrerythrin
MSLLKAEPPAPVKTLEELFAIAHAMEHEAATRYAEIGARMRQDDNPALAEVFERLAAEEQGHLDAVVHWSERQKGKVPDPARIRWQLPETFDDEGAGTTDPRLLSAYRALSMAVRNEERAFAFWSYVAAHAEAADVQQAAETMAHEELGHVATFRRERRRAFHAERSRARAHPAGAAAAGMAALERRLAELLELVPAASESQEGARLRAFAEQARRHSDELEQAPIPAPEGLPPGGIPPDPIALAELLADRYLEAADLLRDEDAIARAQAFAARAIARLAWLRRDLPELEARD